MAIVAFEGTIRYVPGLTASADLSTHQHHFVKMSGDATVTVTGDDDRPIGVLMNKPTSGQAASVAGPGSVVKLIAGASFSAGAKLTPAGDGSGKAVGVAAADDPVGAIALIGAGADGDIVPCIVVDGLTLAAS